MIYYSKTRQRFDPLDPARIVRAVVFSLALISGVLVFPDGDFVRVEPFLVWYRPATFGAAVSRDPAHPLPENLPSTTYRLDGGVCVLRPDGTDGYTRSLRVSEQATISDNGRYFAVYHDVGRKIRFYTAEGVVVSVLDSLAYPRLAPDGNNTVLFSGEYMKVFFVDRNFQTVGESTRAGSALT